MDLDFTASFRNLLQYITQILPDISFHKEYQCVIASIPPSLASHSSLARSIYGYILSLSAYRELTSLHIRYLLPTLWFSGICSTAATQISRLQRLNFLGTLSSRDCSRLSRYRFK